MTQLTRADLAHMTPDQITSARRAGQLDVLLGADPADVAVKDKARGTEPLTLDDVRHLARIGEHYLINDAHRAGRITTPSTQTQE